MRVTLFLTYRNFDKITFPAYKLPSDNVSSVDGILTVDGHILDDKNMSGKTLGVRRLQSPHYENMYTPRRIVSDRLPLILRGSGTYIDNAGKVFTYQKTKFCKLKYHRILNIEKKRTYSLLSIAGTPVQWEIPYPPDPEFTYVGVLYKGGHPWLLYEYVKVKKKDTRRKI